MLDLGADLMKRFISRLFAGRSLAAVIECGLILVVIGLACVTAWVHISTMLGHRSHESTLSSVETTGSVRRQGRPDAPLTRRTAPFFSGEIRPGRVNEL
jgi:Flp pilus assembly pilin Flp